jgi:hypothetical protein
MFFPQVVVTVDGGKRSVRICLLALKEWRSAPPVPASTHSRRHKPTETAAARMPRVQTQLRQRRQAQTAHRTTITDTRDSKQLAVEHTQQTHTGNRYSQRLHNIYVGSHTDSIAANSATLTGSPRLQAEIAKVGQNRAAMPAKNAATPFPISRTR